jgi:hypothetical protein
MKILYIKSGMHHKNHNAVINYKNISYYISDNISILNSIDLSQFDCVYIPCFPVDVSKYPNTKFLFGPHFSVFPENNHMNLIRGKNVVYIQPSEWAAKVWQTNQLCANIRVAPLSFGVDTEKFKEEIPLNERNKIFICAILPGHTLHKTSIWVKKIRFQPNYVKRILKNNIPVGSFVKTKELSEIINFMIKSQSNILNGALIDCENGPNT